MKDNSQLKIYKASAGSGKTFTLAASYITLLAQNPESYRHILAVTFTNKATGEMKERILSQLYGIAHSLPSSEAYLRAIQAQLEQQGISEDMAHNALTPERIRKNAETALTNILHNYSFFRIETIDSFMLSILRNLAKELNLGHNMDIELDEKKVIKEGVQELLRDLELSSPELNWIYDYIKGNIDDEKRWDVTDELNKFAKNLHKEEYLLHSDEIEKALKENPGLIKQLQQHLNADKHNAETALKEKAEAFFHILEANGLAIEDFNNKEKGVCGYFINIKNGTYEAPGIRAQKAMNDPEEWTTKTSKKKDIIKALAESQLIDLLTETEKLRITSAKKINTADLILHNLHQLQLIGSINDKIEEISHKENRFLLADTCVLLRRMASDESDTSFIYEKTGTEIDHILIDEFQDTSGMQWANFLPLLRENLSRGKTDIIVGDVKQSIYRWRDSNADIMENDIQSDLATFNPQEVPLVTNHRSRKAIVDFNNAFFKNLIEALKLYDSECDTGAIAQYYRDVEQKCKEDNEGGSVLIVDVAKEGDEDTDEAMCRATAQEIVKLLDAGVKQNEIAILARKNDKIATIAEWIGTHPEELGGHTVNIVSGEAYSLDSSRAILLLISTLRWISSPAGTKEEDIISFALMGIAYHELVLSDSLTITEILEKRDSHYELPTSIAEKHDELAALPLPELVYQLYERYTLCRAEGHDAYLQSFFDLVQRYAADKDGNLSEFLEEWDDTLKDVKIPAGKVDGIQAMTIHKSKGLEFHSVIVPFCDWEIEPHSHPTLWVAPNEKVGEGLPYLPVPRKSEMKESDFAEAYKKETRQLWTDNLNLLYVAFTRPTTNLVVLRKAASNKSSSESKPPTTVADFLALGLEEGMTNFGEGINNFGEGISPYEERKNPGDANPFILTPSTQPILFHSSPLTIPFRQSNASKTYINRGDDSPMSEFIERGNLLHDIFAHISTSSDAHDYIRRLFRMGLIDRAQEEEITAFIEKAIAEPEVKDWFSGTYELYNECTILSKDENGDIRQNRPDRVMISGNRAIVVDFKFGQPLAKHKTQVKDYMNLLSQMGFTQINGFLWYVTLSQIQQV
ncbi:MAG: UvrD-helicase domain-containing protein [Bacteroidaceae bacterium]|nr:UvrD-helicase domain-containing protein [Bacteroidaceae bacterium]